MKYDELTEIARAHNREQSPGSESSDWHEYVADCVRFTGHTPWSQAILDEDVPESFANYWVSIFNGED